MGSLTNKQKFIALLIGALVFLWLAHVLAFSKTIDMWSASRETAQKIEMEGSAAGRLMAVKKQHLSLDAIIDRNLAHGNDFREQLLLAVTDACNQHKVKFLELQETHFFQKETFLVETHVMQISGRYSQLISLLNQLEKSKNIGSIKSVYFFRKKEYRSNREILIMELYVQAIRKPNEKK